MVNSIQAKLPIAEDANFEDLLEEVCTSMYVDFESFVKETIPAELNEELEINIPTLDTFMNHMKGMDQCTMTGVFTPLIIRLFDLDRSKPSGY